MLSLVSTIPTSPVPHAGRRWPRPSLSQAALHGRSARPQPLPARAASADAAPVPRPELPAWQANVVTHAPPAAGLARARAALDPSTVRGYVLEAQNRADPEALFGALFDFQAYAAKQGLGVEVLLAGPTAA